MIILLSLLISLTQIVASTGEDQPDDFDDFEDTLSASSLLSKQTFLLLTSHPDFDVYVGFILNAIYCRQANAKQLAIVVDLLNAAVSQTDLFVRINL